MIFLLLSKKRSKYSYQKLLSRELDEFKVLIAFHKWKSWVQQDLKKGDFLLWSEQEDEKHLQTSLSDFHTHFQKLSVDSHTDQLK